jgi:hypothetical protein
MSRTQGIQCHPSHLSARTRFTVGFAVLALTAAACGGGGDGKASTSGKAESATSDSASGDPGTGDASGSTGDAAGSTAGLPAQCTAAPYTVTALRDGSKPAGSAEFTVTGAAAIPVPLVPNPDNTIPVDEVMQLGDTTDLLLYTLIFADEPIDTATLDMFSGYTPVGAGNARGFISIAPTSNAPLKAGDVVSPGPLSLDLQTTLSQVGMDFKAAPDELTAYLESAVGQVTILGLTESAICIDADLSWKYSDFASEALGTLQLKGIFTAPLTPRSFPFS